MTSYSNIKYVAWNITTKRESYLIQNASASAPPSFWARYL